MASAARRRSVVHDEVMTEVNDAAANITLRATRRPTCSMSPLSMVVSSFNPTDGEGNCGMASSGPLPVSGHYT
jgi:hypothetical protein